MQIPIFWEDFLQDFGASGGWGWVTIVSIHPEEGSSTPFKHAFYGPRTLAQSCWNTKGLLSKLWPQSWKCTIVQMDSHDKVQVTIHTWVMAGKEVCVCGGGRGVKMDILRSESGLFRSESSASMHGSDIQST